MNRLPPCGDPECKMGAYRNTVPMPINHRVFYIDGCIADLVAALTACGAQTETVACCCGHDRQLGTITLKDGRVLVIAPDQETAERIMKLEADSE